MTHDTKAIATQLAIALNLRAKAKLHAREDGDNPLDQQPLDQIIHGAGIRKGADKIPAVNIAANPSRNIHPGAGLALEGERIRIAKSAGNARAAQRQAAARARAKKKQELDEIIRSDVRPKRKRLAAAWDVALTLQPEIDRLARSKARWAERFLGSVVEDVPQIVLERVALVVAKSDRDVDVLLKAAKAVAKRKMPEDKAVRIQRKWLGGMVYNMVLGTLVDLYTSDENLRNVNLDIIATVMASIAGVGEDPLTSRFKADRAPSMVGTRFQAPGTVDYMVVATAVAGAIREHGLDQMADLLLDHLRNDGTVAWQKVAEEVFLASPDGMGEHYWDTITQASERMKRPSKAQAEAARNWVRHQFSWLPEVIVGVVRAHDVEVVGYGVRPVLASRWEWDYLAYHKPDADPLGERRTPLQPELIYADAKEAAAALDEVLVLIEARDLVVSGMES